MSHGGWTSRPRSWRSRASRSGASRGGPAGPKPRRTVRRPRGRRGGRRWGGIGLRGGRDGWASRISGGGDECTATNASGGPARASGVGQGPTARDRMRTVMLHATLATSHERPGTMLASTRRLVRPAPALRSPRPGPAKRRLRSPLPGTDAVLSRPLRATRDLPHAPALAPRRRRRSGARSAADRAALPLRCPTAPRQRAALPARRRPRAPPARAPLARQHALAAQHAARRTIPVTALTIDPIAPR